MGFAHVEKKKHRLGRRRGSQLGLDPSQLGTEAPGVARELKALKRCRQYSTGFAGGVEPIHSAAADGAVALAAEAIDHIRPLEAIALLTVVASMAGKGHPEQLAGLGIEPGLAAINHPRSEPHPERRVAPIGEITRGHGPMQGANVAEVRKAARGISGGKRVVAAGVEAEQQHRA